MIFNGKYQHIYTFVNGNLVKEQNSLGTITYQYDNKNNWKYNNNLEMTTDVLSYLNEEFYTSKLIVELVLMSSLKDLILL